jgi:uncharacterized membrane protein YphA (DoxX/SURF4 family)
MTRWTCVFLVLLRLTIGWHFLFEGLAKIDNPNWSSEPYLLEANGPLAPAFRWLAGDSVAERYAVTPLAEGQDPAKAVAQEHFPPALDREWNDYFNRFVAYYHIDGDQLKEVEAKLRQSKDQTTRWLLQGTATVKRESPWGPPVDVEMTTPQRLAEYQKKLSEARERQDSEYGFFSEDAKVRSAKTAANKQRADLKRDLAAQTAAMRQSLRSVLTADQVKASLADVLTDVQLETPEVKRAKETVKSRDDLDKVIAKVLTPDQVGYDPVPPPGQMVYGKFRWVPPTWGMSRLQWIDWLTRYGLFAVGVGLLAGFLTRTACVLGAGFLLMFYLAMPALPWLPENPKAEGHYFFINKNIIEMLALLALATTYSGRWLGLDGLLQFLSPWRWKRRPAAAPLGRVTSKQADFKAALPSKQ